LNSPINAYEFPNFIISVYLIQKLATWWKVVSVF